MQKLAIYGDSILKGVVFDAESGRYTTTAVLNYASLAEKHSIEIINRAKFGCTITRGAHYLRTDLERGADFDTCVLEFGGNDCDFDWKRIACAPEESHQPLTPFPLFLETYTTLIRELAAAGVRPVLAVAPPISPSRYLAHIASRGSDTDAILSWLGDVNTIYRYQERYTGAVRDLAYQKGLACIDLRTPFLSVHNTDALLCADGIHPNPAGQALLYQTLDDAIARL